MLKIEFNHTGIQAKKNKKAILKKISNIVDSGIFLNGKEEQNLNKKLKKLFGQGYFITTASGHDSLMLAIRSLNLSLKDEVIFPVNSYPTAFPVFLSNVNGIPCDVDKNGQIDPKDLLNKITKKTKAVIAVHLYGLVGELDKIIQICRDKKLILIEDCAQAFGTKYKDKYVGTFGDIGCFSFYPTKNLGTLGDGGGIWIKKKEHYQFLIKAKSYGEKIKFFSEFVSGHSRIPEIQASIVSLYLKNFKKDASRRKKLYFYFKSALQKSKLNPYIRILTSDNKSSPVPHLFVITAKKRDALLKFLNKKNITSYVRYPYAVNTVPAFSFLKKVTYKQAEKLSKEILCLPFHQYLKKRDINYMISIIKTFYS